MLYYAWNKAVDIAVDTKQLLSKGNEVKMYWSKSRVPDPVVMECFVRECVAWLIDWLIQDA